jgi:predicted nucleotidyltransferase component of viral defense system
VPDNKLNFGQIRRTAITALFSDDVLTEYLVLKGGNALDLIYGITARTSIDLDFSMKQDFEDSSDARNRLFSALRDRFDAVGYVLFDERFDARPDLKGGPDEKPWWGGYEISFKLIEREKYQSLKDRPGKLRVNALVLGSGDKRSFKIDLSKCEYTDGKAEHEVDQFTIYVYTPTMIAVEKIRAICQQMPEYPHTGNKKARARDFYDIYQVLTTCDIDLSTKENQILMRHIFEIKQVPLSLLSNIGREREFHRRDWQSVVDATAEELQTFDFYFDSVIGEVERLKSFWVE